MQETDIVNKVVKQSQAQTILQMRECFRYSTWKSRSINTVLESTEKSLMFAEDLQFYYWWCLYWRSCTSDCCFHFLCIVADFCVYCPFCIYVNWISEPFSHFSFCGFLILMSICLLFMHQTLSCMTCKYLPNLC